MKINSIYELAELSIGSNCFVYKGVVIEDNKNIVAVVKVSKRPVLSDIVGNIVVSDIENVRNVLINSGVEVPKLYICAVGNTLNLKGLEKVDTKRRLVIVENYAGESIRDLINSASMSKVSKRDLLKMCNKFIKTLPENIPLDTNTGNIVYDGVQKKLSFVDFIPPDPWLHLKDKNLMRSLYKMFPTVSILIEDKGGKERYYNNDKRWEKFVYYLNKNSIPSSKLVLG